MQKHLLLLLCLFAGCRGEENTLKTNEANSKESYYNQGNKLIGLWSIVGEGNSLFKISIDSIYYLESNTTYKYEVKEDSLFIYHDGYIYKSSYNFSKDKLIITGSNGIDTFVEFNR